MLVELAWHCKLGSPDIHKHMFVYSDGVNNKMMDLFHVEVF